MKIKSMLIGIFSLLLTVGFASTASAELISVSAGIPISHSVSGYSTVTTQGVLVHASLPFIPVGLGVEKYSTVFSNLTLTSLDTVMYDAFYLLPIPVLNVTLGLGIGKATPLGTSTLTNSPATMSQYYMQVGFPFLPFIDAHLSYHKTMGTLKGHSGNPDISVNGEVIGLGVAFTF